MIGCGRGTALGRHSCHRSASPRRRGRPRSETGPGRSRAPVADTTGCVPRVDSTRHRDARYSWPRRTAGRRNEADARPGASRLPDRSDPLPRPGVQLRVARRTVRRATCRTRRPDGRIPVPRTALPALSTASPQGECGGQPLRSPARSDRPGESFRRRGVSPVGAAVWGRIQGSQDRRSQRAPPTGDQGQGRCGQVRVAIQSHVS